jgi:pimeloyl-ACP methyl ester carboxylesterase
MSLSVRDLELTAGKYGLAFLRRATAAAAGLRAGVTDGVAYWHRPGEGVPVVAIHGFGGDKETWLLWAPFVGRRRPLLLIDLPGHGMSRDARDGDFGARAQAEIVLATMDACGVDGAAVLCGNSMGGGIAQRIARTWPSRAAALVLVASVAHEMAESELTRELARGQNFLIPDEKTTHDDFLKKVVEKPPRVPRAVQRYVASERARAQPRLERVWRGWVGAAGDDGVPADVEAIAQPALVVHGDRDRVIAVETGRALAAKLPRGRLAVLEGIGHVPQLEDPWRVARLTEAFLREVLP